MEIDKLKFEFLRDDPEVIAAYNRVQELHKRAEYSPDYYLQDEKGKVYPYWGTKEAEEELQICKDLGIRPPFPDVKKSYDELTGGPPVWDDDKGLHIHTARQAWRKFWLSKTLMTKGIRLWFNRNSPKNFSIEIDLKHVPSLTVMFEDIERRVKEHIDKQIPNWERTNSKQLDEYQQILKIGRTYFKTPGATYEQLAAEIFPDEYLKANSKQQEALRGRIRTHIGNYKRLTTGGWRKLTSI